MSKDPTSRSAIVALDKAHVWHPYTNMAAWIDYGDPIVVRRAEGCFLEDVDGTRYIDGNASWWTAAMGHGHPRITGALLRQAGALGHCALGGITHEPAVRLAERLARSMPDGLDRVFFTDNGSSAIEVAVKIAIQHWRQRRRPEKTRFLALDGAFHGDTIGAASLGGVEVFRRPFADILFECFRAPSPADGYESAFAAIDQLLAENHRTIAAIVVEPLVQGAEGMRMYPPAYLARLAQRAKELDVLLIVDEVFTGFGRTGKMWAFEHAGITPDLVCLGKALAFPIPMGATLVNRDVFASFSTEDSETLLYGHTFCGNPLGAAIGLEVFSILEDENLLAETERKGAIVGRWMRDLARVDGVTNPRQLGLIGAVDLVDMDAATSPRYLQTTGWRVYEEARRRGAYLRPLGSTVYLCPPLVIDDATLERLLRILTESVHAVMGAATPKT